MNTTDAAQGMIAGCYARKHKPFMLKVCALLVACFGLGSCQSAYTGFINYKPSEFTEQAAVPFFFSIGSRLKYGDAVTEGAPTLLDADLLNGSLDAVYPSPDQKKAVVTVGESAYLIVAGQQPTKIFSPKGEYPYSVKSKNFGHVPCGTPYFVDYQIQWDQHSQYIFVPRMVKAGSPDARQCDTESFQSSLVRFDISEPKNPQEIVSREDFHSQFTYFIIDKDSACFGQTMRGEVPFKCWLNSRLKSVASIGANGVTFLDGTKLAAKPFLSYQPNHKSNIWLADNGYSFTGKPGSNLISLFHDNSPGQPIFTVTGGIEPLKGHFLDGLRDNISTILPGGRYAFIGVFDKKLIVDASTGKYREVPSNTQVYVNFNSLSKPDSLHIVSTGRGSYRFEFVSLRPLRTY